MNSFGLRRSDVWTLVLVGLVAGNAIAGLLLTSRALTVVACVELLVLVPLAIFNLRRRGSGR